MLEADDLFIANDHCVLWQRSLIRSASGSYVQSGLTGICQNCFGLAAILGGGRCESDLSYLTCQEIIDRRQALMAASTP